MTIPRSTTIAAAAPISTGGVIQNGVFPGTSPPSAAAPFAPVDPSRWRGGFFVRLPRARPLLATISASSSSPVPAGLAATPAGAFSVLSPLRYSGLAEEDLDDEDDDDDVPDFSF